MQNHNNQTTQNSQASENLDFEQISQEEIQAWLVAYLAELLELSPDNIDMKASFDRYGLDSSAAISLISDLGDCLGREIDPDSLSYYPTIESLAKYLSETEEIIM